MGRRRFLFTLSSLVVLSMFLGSSSADAAVAKAGTTCLKLGSKSGSLICSKVNGKLKWTLVKKSQKISFVAPQEASVEMKSLNITAQSTSKLPVSMKSLTPDICLAANGVVTLGGKPGLCSISLTQSGNATYLAAPVVTFEMKIVGVNLLDFQAPGALLLSQKSYDLTASGSSSAPIVFTSKSTNNCTVTGSTLQLLSIGDCVITANQAADDLYPAAAEVSRTIEISAARVTADLPDAVSGFQVKAIYVVPSDGTDHSYDINGELKMVLDDGLAYMRDQLGQEIPIDSTENGYDIGFFKSSKPSEYFMTTSGSYAELLRESKVLDSPGTNRKNYIFFIDTDTIIDPGYCGEALRPGMVAVVAIGAGECGKQTNFFTNYASQTWVHEIFHNFGVSHVASACDLMTSGQVSDGPLCPPGQLHTIDAERKLYVGATLYGADISKLRVWKGFTNNKDLIADCYVTPTGQAGIDGIKFSYCPTGKQSIGPATYCWTNVNSVALDQFVNGAWVRVGAGATSVQPWGERVDWKCVGAGFVAPTIQINVESPGVSHYRWLVNGDVAEEMKIIWVS